MKKISFFNITLPAFLLLANAVFAQTKTPLEGVWKISEVIIPENGTTTTVSHPQPGLIIFTKGYYSILAVQGVQPRVGVEPPKDPENLTDSEKIARFAQWSPFTAQSGTYEIKGSTLIWHPIVAKNVNVMNRETPVIHEFKLESTSTFWLNPTPDRSATEPRFKLARLE
jgi:hypothetical protein